MVTRLDLPPLAAGDPPPPIRRVAVFCASNPGTRPAYMEAAAALGGQVQASAQYWRCLPRQAQGVFGPEARINMR